MKVSVSKHQRRLRLSCHSLNVYPFTNIIQMVSLYLIKCLPDLNYMIFKLYLFLNCYSKFKTSQILYTACIQRILYECLYCIKFIKRVEEKGQSAWLAEHFISFFRNEFNKFNKIRTHMLDSIYYMTLKLLEITFLAWKRQYLAIMYPTKSNGRHYVTLRNL